MANIKNKFSQPLSTEFSPKDLVVDIKNGHLYYKSNLGVHKLIGDNLSTNTEDERGYFTAGIEVVGDVKVSGSDSNEGGQLTLLPKIGGGYTWNVDNYQENFRLFTEGTETAVRMQISSSGNVGIGTTGPDKLLTVKQSKADEFISRFQNSSGTNPDGIIIRLDKDEHTNRYISFQRNGGNQVGSITGTGDGGMNPDNANKVSYNESSDRRLKSNIRDCDFTIDDLDKIQMRSYTMGGGDNQVGVIAQELLNTPYKWMVYTGNEENKSNNLKEGDNGYQYMQVGYNHFTPLLIKSVQDANKMIKELQQELKILKKKVNG